MKVMLCHRPGGAFGYITDGWLNALRDRGHTVERWDGNETSWRQFQPDLYIGCSGHKQPIPGNRSLPASGTTKIAIHVNPYGPVEIPGIMETKPNIDWVKNQRPDVVFGYGHEEDRLLWSHWKKKLGIPWAPMPTAGDRILFHQQTSLDDRSVDLVYLGGRWPYKAQTIDILLLPLVRHDDVSFKIHGWGEWPDGVCDGILPADQPNQFLNTGKIGPCISEKHTQQFGMDVPERAFKVALCGTLVVHDSVPGLQRLLPSAVIAKNPQNFVALCVELSKDDAKRKEIVEKQRNEVLAENTYHHRIRTLLTATGFSVEADGMVD